MKRYILLTAILLCGIALSWGQAIGSWKAYPALQISNYNEPVGDRIYSLCNGNLFSYNIEDTEVHVYDRLNGLNDTKIKILRYCNTTGKLVLIYENGNIDLLYPDDQTSNLKQLKDKNYPSLSINNAYVFEKYVYICTNFGIVVLDTEDESFENTYDLGVNVMCCAVNQEFVYLSSSAGFYKGDRSKNLLDKNNWERVSTNAFNALAFFENELVGYNSNTGVFIINRQYFSTTAVKQSPLKFFSCRDNVMIVGHATQICIYKSFTDVQEIMQPNTFDYMTFYKNNYWASQGVNGLQPYTLEGGTTFSPTLSAIQPNSPVRDYFCNMYYNGNRLLVAGGEQNYSGVVREGTVMYYENGTWHNFSEEGIAEATGHNYNNVSSVVQDPNDPTHHFASSAGHGLYEFKDLKFVQNYDETNSPLRMIDVDVSNPQDYTRCDALQYDAEGNLWMVNTEVDTVLVVRKADGTWTKLYYEELKMAPNFTRIFFDEKGRLWTNSKRNHEGTGGIFVLDCNGTLEDTSDDIHIKRTGITNQDGVNYSPYFINCFTQDLNQQIWVGTEQGLFVIEDPDDFIDNDNFTYTQIKIPRNDGTDYADYLLNGVNISAIAIDAANRKWIGTAADGIYLVSADGQEIVQHFTTDNSPLLSNEVLSIAVNPQTGEVMIGTFLGLVSYMSDANTPAPELDKNNVRVYPNPVRPDYNGVITVDGLTQNAEVKITTVTGQLVYSGHANGGLFTWNGRDKQGRRVSSGVYNIISTNMEGKKAIVNRVTFIR